MAKVSEIFCLHAEVEFDDDEEESSQSEADFEAETLDFGPCWSSSVFEEETLIPPTPEISLLRSDYEDEITPSLDLLETLDTTDFRVLDGIEPMDPDYLGAGLRLGFDVEDEQEEEEPEEEGDPLMDHGDGLCAGEWVSDSDSLYDPNPRYHGPNLPLYWDSLIFEGGGGEDDDFEWEEVDGRLEERDFLSTMVGGRSASSELDDDLEHDGEEEEGEGRNVDWEVLLSVSNVVVEEGDFINPLEYEVLFEQFADNDSAIRGTPPAAKSVVNNLPSIVLTQEDVAKNNTVCAVCKDDISLEEKVKQLPCLHHYHGDCILPWLGMRNTCPVCRYELLTDDPEYENWKAQRRASNEGRYDLEMFAGDLM